MKTNFAYAGAGGTAAGVKQQFRARLSFYGGDVASLAHEAVAAMKRWYNFRRTVRELSELDDRMLADIGLHRSEIAVTAYALAERHANARPTCL